MSQILGMSVMESSDVVPDMFGNTVCNTSATSNLQEKRYYSVVWLESIKCLYR